MEDSNDREVKSRNPEYLKISCGICRLESHISKPYKIKVLDAEEEFRKFIKVKITKAIILETKK
jgi:regulatory protein YycI of two-component signal transduction system YycFG